MKSASIAARARHVPLVAGVLVALPLLVFRGTPMTDLAHHEGMIALLVHAGDDAFTRGIYALNLGHANQLFYAVAWPLALVFGSGFACRLVVAGIVVATFAATAKLCDHVGAARWAALLVAPAAMGWTFFFGFAPNLLGLALFVAFVPRLDAFVTTPTARGALLATGLVAVLHFAHETSALCAAAAIVIFALGRRGTLVDWVLRAVPVAVVALLAYVEMAREVPVLTAFGRQALDQGIVVQPIEERLVHVVDYVIGYHPAYVGWLMTALVLATLAAFGVEKFKARAPSGAPPLALAESLVRYRYEVLAASFFALYCVAPYSINFGSFLSVRFLAPAYVLAVVSVARGTKGTSAAKALSLTVPMAWVAIVAPSFADADRERAKVDVLLAQIDEGSTFAVFALGEQERARPYDVTTLGNRALAQRGGRALHSFVEYPIAPLVIRPGLAWDDAVVRTYLDPMALRPAFDLTRFRYVLARIPDDAWSSRIARAMAPDAVLAGTSGAWRLFVSTHAMVPIDSPDMPPPDPPPPTLRARVDATRARP